MTRPILTVPHDALRAVCAPVTVFDAALADLTEEMFAAMYAAPGRGLAAPQIGVLERIFVMDVTWTDLDGAMQSERFTGLWATCVQHEIDHLDGKLFIDYLKPLKRQMITRKMQKLKRERARA